MITGKQAQAGPAPRTELDRVNAKIAQAKYEKMVGDLIPKDEVRDGLQRALLEFWAELERRFCVELPPVLKGMEEKAVSDRCQKAIEEFKRSIREKFGR